MATTAQINAAIALSELELVVDGNGKVTDAFDKTAYKAAADAIEAAYGTGDKAYKGSASDPYELHFAGGAGPGNGPVTPPAPTPTQVTSDKSSLADGETATLTPADGTYVITGGLGGGAVVGNIFTADATTGDTIITGSGTATGTVTITTV